MSFKEHHSVLIMKDSPQSIQQKFRLEIAAGAQDYILWRIYEAEGGHWTDFNGDENTTHHKAINQYSDQFYCCLQMQACSFPWGPFSCSYLQHQLVE